MVDLKYYGDQMWIKFDVSIGPWHEYFTNRNNKLILICDRRASCNFFCWNPIHNMLIFESCFNILEFLQEHTSHARTPNTNTTWNLLHQRGLLPNPLATLVLLNKWQWARASERVGIETSNAICVDTETRRLKRLKWTTLRNLNYNFGLHELNAQNFNFKLFYGNVIRFRVMKTSNLLLLARTGTLYNKPFPFCWLLRTWCKF